MVYKGHISESEAQGAYHCVGTKQAKSSGTAYK